MSEIEKDNERELSEREQAVLRTIINLYILNATPIGSRNLSKYLERDLKLSPATLRNVMSDLEELSYITHPHTSAGRVPTDKGYRFYVDTISPHELTPKLPIEQLAGELNHTAGDNFLKDAGKLLGVISHYLAIVRIPQIQDLIVRKIELICLSSTKLLVVVALDSDIVRTVTLEIPYNISENAIFAVSHFVNEKVGGKSLSFIRNNFREMVKTASGELPPLIGLFVDSIDELFRTETGNDKLHLAGTQNLLNFPEFSDVSKIRSMFDLLGNEEVLISMLGRGIQPQKDNFTVYIGSEMQNEALEDYSLVVSNYTFGSAGGTIGLIGPRRMDYSRVISLVRSMSEIISG